MGVKVRVWSAGVPCIWLKRAAHAPWGAPHQDIQQEQQEGDASAIRPQRGGGDTAVPPWREDFLRPGREHPAGLLAQRAQERQVRRQQAILVRVGVEQTATTGSRDIGRAQSRTGKQLEAPGYATRRREWDLRAILARRDLTQRSHRALSARRRD